MRNQSPLIYGYLKRYQDDPNSRVFAPLAEAYRKAGLVDEAIDIAREGLKVHPSFVGGRVALGRALFDKRMYKDVVDELAPITREVPDNLVAQRLLAESSLMLGRIADALGAYKMLLFFNPNDKETAQIVFELEAQAYEKGALVLQNDPKPLPTRAETKTSEQIAPLSSDPQQKERRVKWMKKIELLQTILLKAERYRVMQR